jgi:hypothetical protein
MEAAEVAGMSQASAAADVRELVTVNGKEGAFVGGGWGGSWERDGLPGCLWPVIASCNFARIAIGRQHGAK